MNKTARVLVYCVAMAAATSIFIKGQIAAGFRVLFSNRYDGFIQVSILEHWYNFWLSKEPWRQILYFYPYSDTLGYNDGFFLYGIPYTLFRQIGVDPFLSNELTTVVVRLLAFVGTELFLRSVLRLPWYWAIFGAVIFTIASGASAQAHHGQLLSAAFTPWFGVLLWEAGAAFNNRNWRAAALWATLACLLMGSWLLTSFYMAWFTLFYTLCLALLGLARLRTKSMDLAKSIPQAGWLTLGVIMLVSVLSVSPFLVVYLPTSHETGGHRFEEVSTFLGQPLDLTFIGDGNPLLSGLDQAVESTFRPGESRFNERTTGLTWGLLLVFVTACGGLWRRRANDDMSLVGLLGATAVLTWGFTLVVHGHTLWRLIYFSVPGASALRVIVRYNLFLVGPVVAVTTAFLAGLRKRIPAILLAIIATILLAEQINFRKSLALDRTAELAWLASVPPQPPVCRSFFVSAARPGRYFDERIDALYSHNVDAMLLAELRHLPTINGFSTFNPPDWNFNNPDDPGYSGRVRAYAASHRLTGLCGLDLAKLQWDAAPLK